MKSFVEQCEAALIALNKVSETNALDEFEQRAIQYIEVRIQSFKSGNTLAEKYRGELSRMVQEFNPNKLSSKLGASLMEIEKSYFENSR